MLVMKKVLIIENDTAIRENIAELLELNHFRVLTAENGLEGFELAKKDLPDVVIYNITMPEKNGENFLFLSKNEVFIKNIPIIYSIETLLPRGFQMVIEEELYLKKPFTEEKLLLTINKALNRIKT